MVKVGDKIPAMKLMVATAEGPREADTAELFGPGKVVMFAVPGAFTPTCSIKHLPGFAENLDAFKAKGVDRIICMAVNDVFVLGAWAKSQPDRRHHHALRWLRNLYQSTGPGTRPYRPEPRHP